MDRIDTAEALYVLLSNNSALVTELTDTDSIVNIYGPPGLPLEFTLRKAVMYLGDGGGEEGRIPITRESFSFLCYGRQSNEARDVYAALYNVFRFIGHHTIQVRGRTVHFLKATKLSGPSDQMEPVEGWPFVACSFYIQWYEEFAS